MIVNITKVTKHTITDLNLRIGQNQRKIKRVMTAWSVLLKIQSKTVERFSDLQKSKNKCYGV